MTRTQTNELKEVVEKRVYLGRLSGPVREKICALICEWEETLRQITDGTKTPDTPPNATTHY